MLDINEIQGKNCECDDNQASWGWWLVLGICIGVVFIQIAMGIVETTNYQDPMSNDTGEGYYQVSE